jgi:hypothetical protein
MGKTRGRDCPSNRGVRRWTLASLSLGGASATAYGAYRPRARLPSGDPAVSSDTWSFETRQIHAGAAPDPATGARATPVYQTTSFVLGDTQRAENLFALAELGNIYTRIMNPTTDVVEQRIASLEGGVAAVALASGQAAETLAILNIAQAGDHLVSSASLYGGTYNLFRYTLPRMGIETTYVEDPDDLDAWRAAIRPNTKLLFAESIGNPKIDVPDLAGIADVAHDAGVPLIVDNTIATPYLIRPFEHGADIVVHSATKFLGGHGTAIAGVVVDGGTFDWGAQAERFPGLTTPDPSYNDLNYWEALGNEGGAYAMTSHLLSVGHRQIAFMGTRPNLATSTARVRGYKRAHHELGLETDPELIIEGAYVRSFGLSGTRELLRKRPDVTAIFAATDVVATGVLQAVIQGEGDVGLVSFATALTEIEAGAPLGYAFPEFVLSPYNISCIPRYHVNDPDLGELWWAFYNMDAQYALAAAGMGHRMRFVDSEAQYFPLQVVQGALDVIEQAKEFYNPDLEWLGVVMNIADMRTVHSRDAYQQLREHYGDKVFDTIIRSSIAYAESAERGLSILDHRPDLGADYLALADEVLRRIGLRDARRALKPLLAG